MVFRADTYLIIKSCYKLFAFPNVTKILKILFSVQEWSDSEEEQDLDPGRGEHGNHPEQVTEFPCGVFWVKSSPPPSIGKKEGKLRKKRGDCGKRSKNYIFITRGGESCYNTGEFPFIYRHAILREATLAFE